MHSTFLAPLRGELDRAASESHAVFQERRDARLRHLLRSHFESARNTAYRGLLEQHGITSVAGLPRTALDIEELPIVEKDFLRTADYKVRPAVAPEEVRFVVTTSGSTGNPLEVPHSHAFQRRIFGELFARIHLMLGREDLLAEPAYYVGHYTPSTKYTGTYAAFTQLCELLGESARMGNTSDPIAHHLRMLLDRGARSACSAPGFFLALVAGAQAQGVDLGESALELVIVGGAPVSAENRARLVTGLGLRTLCLGYVSSELGWIGVQLGDDGPYAIFADEFLVEVVDDDGHHVAPGEYGRVLVTALSSDAAPLVRYANGDRARYLGYGRPYRNFPLLDDIGRDTLAIIGDGKVSYEDMAEMPRTMAALGAPVAAFQLAKRLAPDGRDQIHLRVELIDPGQDAAHVEGAAVHALRRHPHMDFHLAGGELPPPIVETYAPGHLTAGRFKVPLYVDETKTAITAR
ncbi:MAG TPA: AMP-binding protein [Ktedonobacterales bacterium]